jgi:hypothetical protein
VVGIVPSKRSILTVWRVLVVVSCVLLAWLSFASAVVHIVRESNPTAALKLVANDPVALSGRAESALASATSSALVSGDVKNLVLESLRFQAINPRALRQLGFIADANGQSASAKRLIQLSERTSRREFGAQLWLIENGIQSDNIRATLVHYDIALRSGYDNGAILYPILASALDDREVQIAFARYINPASPWLGPFLSYAITQGQNPIALAATIMRGGGLPDGEGYRDFERQLLAQMAAKARYQDAREYYLSLANADPKVLVSIGFDAAVISDKFVPISWEVQNSPGVAAAFDGVKNNGRQRLNISAGSGEQGIVLRKLLFVAAGRYNITQNVKSKTLTGGAVATWEVKCLGTGTERVVWRADFGSSVGRQILPPFDIPSDCTTQSVALIISGGSNQEGSEVVLTDVELRSIKLLNN